jgi:hypothetical protein
MKICEATVRDLVARKKTDRQIAALIGASRAGVFRCRARLNLPAGYDPADPPEHVRQARLRVYRLLSERGHRKQQAARASLCRRYGLPAELMLSEMKIVMALVDGPATLAEVNRRCGWRADKKLCGSRRNWMGKLIAHGLVASIPRHNPAGRGRLPNLYTLTLKALELLSQGADRGKTEQGEAVAGPQEAGEVEDAGGRQPLRQAG